MWVTRYPAQIWVPILQSRILPTYTLKIPWVLNKPRVDSAILVNNTLVFTPRMEWHTAESSKRIVFVQGQVSKICHGYQYTSLFARLLSTRDPGPFSARWQLAIKPPKNTSLVQHRTWVAMAPQVGQEESKKAEAEACARWVILAVTLRINNCAGINIRDDRGIWTLLIWVWISTWVIFGHQKWTPAWRFTNKTDPHPFVQGLGDATFGTILEFEKAPRKDHRRFENNFMLNCSAGRGSGINHTLQQKLRLWECRDSTNHSIAFHFFWRWCAEQTLA